MNALKRIIIENFQSHQKTIIEPAPAGQLTVIVGPSDVGKTAIIRALRWLFYNQPQGTDFIRTGATFARVTVEYESGHKVVRERTVSTNRYKIVYPDREKPEIFEGFGNNVPLEVQEITGVRSVRIGDENYLLNLSEQLDGPFLGTKQISSPARAKVLGKLAGTEEIDLASSDVGADIYRCDRDKTRLEKDIDDLGKQIKQYDYLPALKETVEQLQGILDNIKTTQDRKTKLENLKFSLITITQNIGQCNQILERWKNLDTITRIVTEAENAKQRRDNLITLRRQNETAEAGIRDAKGIIARHLYLPEAGDMVDFMEANLPKLNKLRDLRARLQNITLAIEQSEKAAAKWVNIGEAEQAQKKITDLVERRRNLVALRQQLQATEGNITAARQSMVVAEQRVAELEGAYKDALLVAGVCPTCGSEITPETLKRAV